MFSLMYIICASERSCGAWESLDKGVITTDYGRAEGRGRPAHLSFPIRWVGAGRVELATLLSSLSCNASLSRGCTSWVTIQGQVHVYPLAFSSQDTRVSVLLGTGNWGTLVSSEPEHSACTPLNQAKNTHPLICREPVHCHAEPNADSCS